jgi:hypothetical protein
MTIFHIQSDKQISDFAADIFSIFEIHDFTEHESLNYPPLNIYFKAKKDEVTFKICSEDDDAHKDSQYWLIVSANRTADLDIKALDESILKKISLAGYVITVEND